MTTTDNWTTIVTTDDQTVVWRGPDTEAQAWLDSEQGRNYARALGHLPGSPELVISDPPSAIVHLCPSCAVVVVNDDTSAAEPHAVKAIARMGVLAHVGEVTGSFWCAACDEGFFDGHEFERVA